MWLRVVGSADTLSRVGASAGVQWDVDADSPLGGREQMERLQRLLGLEGVPFTLYRVHEHMRGEPAALQDTPGQNGLQGEVWVEVQPPREAGAAGGAGGSPSVASICVHPALVQFQRPNMLYLRLVQKHTQRGQSKLRVLILTTRCVYLSHPSQQPTRWLLYNEISEAVIVTEPNGDWVLLRGVAPEHDLLVCLVDHHNNIPVHTTATELSHCLHKSGIAIVAWPHGLQRLLESAHLHKHRGFIPLHRKHAALRHAPVPLMRPGVAHPKLRQKRVPDPAAEPDDRLAPILKEQAGAIGALKEEVETLRRSTVQKREEVQLQDSEAMRSLTEEVMRLKSQNAELARSVLAAQTVPPVGQAGSPPAVPAAAQPPQPLQPTVTLPQNEPSPSPQVAPGPAPVVEGGEGGAFSPPNIASPPLRAAAPPSAAVGAPVSGLTKALLIGVSHGSELPGNTRSLDIVSNFVASLNAAATEVLSDVSLPGLQCYVPTYDNIVAAFKWLAEGALPGQSLWLSLALQARDGGWLTSDGRTVSPAELHRLAVAPLPAGVRLTVLLDCVPPTVTLDLPYCLTCASGVVAAMRKDRPVPHTEAQLVVLGAVLHTQPGVGRSQGELAGTLTRVYVPTLQARSPLTYEQLLQHVNVPLHDATAGWYVPVISSSYPLSKTTLVKMLPVSLSAKLPASPPVQPPQPPSAASPPLATPPHPLPSRASTNPQQPTLPEIKVPLMAPFVQLTGGPKSPPPGQQSQDQEYWRNMVCHAFLIPGSAAFEAPYVLVSSAISGKQARLNKEYVSAFVSQWPVVHGLVITIRLLVEGQWHVARRFQASQDLWDFVKAKVNDLLGMRAVQRRMYPHSRDAQRDENLSVTVEGTGLAEAISCHDQDWLQAVTEWEVDNGFGFTKTSLPLPLMPPFHLDEGVAATEHDTKISTYLQDELSADDETAKSVSFQYDADFVRNLSYHTRLMPGARVPPLFIVEDSHLSHPIMVNQGFLTRYVKAWSRVFPHLVWVHNTDQATLIAKCRVTADFWKYFTTRAPQLQAEMGEGSVVPSPSSVKWLAKYKLTVTSSCSPEAVQVWDGVWCRVVSEWEQSLPKSEPSWSPSRQQPAANDTPASPAAQLPTPLRPPSPSAHPRCSIEL